MKWLASRGRPDVALMVLYLGMALPFQVWASLMGPLPWMNYGHGWTRTLAYGFGAPIAAYLLWRRRPRGRLAAYAVLSFDGLRSARLAHWLPLALDLSIILYLQTPAMRRLYPSMWSRASAALGRGRLGRARRRK